MKIKTGEAQEHEFYLQRFDNHILVENHVDHVVIRATRDNLSEHRKSAFIRHLAMEGYISDQYEWFSDSTGEPLFGVKWIIDYSWLRIHPESTRIANQFMRRLLLGAGLVWALMMVFLFLFKTR